MGRFGKESHHVWIKLFNVLCVDKAIVYLTDIYHFQGEYCVCSSRILIQEGIYDEFVTKFALYAKGMIVGEC